MLVVIVPPSRAGDFNNALSLQGYTGLLNTPNAELTADGHLDTLYTDQKEHEWRNLTSRQDNYLFSVGLLPFAELGGRLTDAPGLGVRDLSANFKVRIPGIPSGGMFPEVAFGTQDVGGGSKKLQTSYAVATETWRDLRLSVGAGAGPDRLKGIFGGVEFRAADWLTLIGENDTKDTNVGVRFASSGLLGLPVSLQATFKTSIDRQPGNAAVAIGLQMPLGNEHLSRIPLPASQPEAKTTSPEPGTTPPSELRNSAAGSAMTFTMATAPVMIPDAAGQSVLSLLVERLVADGFQNIAVGTRAGNELVVEYENGRYNHNELDGLGVVVGTIVDTVPGDHETLKVIVRKLGIAILQVSAPLDDFRTFLHDPGAEPRLQEHLRISRSYPDDDGVTFISNGNPSRFSSALVFYPGLKTFVGTEVGVFDYLLSAKLDYFLYLWKGGVLNARWDVPLAWSENFDEGKPFRDSRQGSQMDRLMLFQTFRAAPAVMVNLGGGMVLHDSYGTLNEAVWAPGDGTHRFSIKQARTESSRDQVQPQTRETYLGSYRYYFSPLNMSLEGTAGRFFDNDRGLRIEMKRFFGDTAFSVYYANSQTSSQEHVQVGGVMISLPLTPRRDMKPGVLQVRGTDEWSYAQETKIVSAGQANTVATSVGVNPTPPFNLERVFFNRDRLNDAYIRAHLLRLRDAYLTYGNRGEAAGNADQTTAPSR